MSMSGAITVDSTAGGTSIIKTGMRTRMMVIANTGAATAFLKFDGSSTTLTAANGHPIAASEKIVIGFGNGADGPDAPMELKAICATTTTIVAQTIP